MQRKSYAKGSNKPVDKVALMKSNATTVVGFINYRENTKQVRGAKRPG